MKYKKITFKAVQKVVNRFKGKTARIDSSLADSEILRMAFIASKIPIAKKPKAILVDVGGSVIWVVIK